MASRDTWHVADCTKREFSVLLKHRRAFSKLRNLGAVLLLWDQHQSLNLSRLQFPPDGNENLYSSLAEQSRGGVKGVG